MPENMLPQQDRDLLIELKTMMTTVQNDIKSMREDVNKKSDDHELRLRSLERSKWSFAGAATLLGTVGGWAVTWFSIHK